MIPRKTLPEMAIRRDHTMVLLAASLAAGVWLALYLRPSPWLLLLFAAAVALSVLLKRLRLRRRAALCLAFLALGLTFAQAALNPAMPAEGLYTVRGVVYGTPKLRTDSRMSFTLRGVTLDGEAQAGSAYVTCYTYDDAPLPELFDGAEIAFSGSVYQPSGMSGPYDFDFRLWLLQNRMSFGISVNQGVTVLNTRQTAPIQSLSARASEAFRVACEPLLGEYTGLATAMLMGQKDGLPDDEMQSFRDSGVAHIVAVSGLHVGILATALMWLLERIGLRKTLRTAIAIVFLWCYCALTGFSPSTTRASVMMTLVLIGQALGLQADPLIMLSTAVVVVLLINPLQLFSASFWLSFGAVGGIQLVYPRLNEALTHRLGVTTTWANARKNRRVARQCAYKALDPMAVSIAAQLGVLIPTACCFHRLPLYGLLTNLVAVPLAGLLVPLYALTLLFSWIPVLNVAVGFVTKLLSGVLIWLTGTVSALPGATVRVGTPPIALTLAFIMLLLLCSRWRMPLRRRFAAIALCVAVGASAVAWQLNRPLRYVQLSAGRADAALLLCRDQTVAIDVGVYGSEVLDYLEAENRSIDLLFLTHLHIDHAGGVAALLDAGIRIGQVYIPYGTERADLNADTLALLDRLADEGIPVRELAAGDEVPYHQGSVRVLFPIRDSVRAGQNANESSMVLLIGLGDYRILSTGDVSDRYEAYFSADCDVLKVAHHGSSTSTSADFLAKASPRVALIGCSGSRSLPADALLNRLADAGAQVYRTDEDGDITLTLRGDQLTLTPYLKRREP